MYLLIGKFGIYYIMVFIKENIHMFIIYHMNIFLSHWISISFLDVKPEKLEAQDGDSLRAEMSYQIVSGKPDDYKEYFKIDRRTGR